MNSIIKIVGNANFSSDFMVKFCDSGFSARCISVGCGRKDFQPFIFDILEVLD